MELVVQTALTVITSAEKSMAKKNIGISDAHYLVKS